ncbi:hypothetical protein WJ64_32685 [Burkholderia ubonensis]|nr:hypothetical protein WJ64_32685 [Burkholderia ubonensis]
MAPDWHGLVLLDRLSLRVRGGSASCRSLRPAAISKLLAFIDAARDDLSESGRKRMRVGSIAVDDPAVFDTQRGVEYWFLQQALERSPCFARLEAFLRGTESYWLVRFLLAQSASGDSLRALGTRYGVSASHFRRLCHSALGNSAKSELRDWRMARSMLDVVESQSSLTEVALAHGYASLSHFSSEIRNLLGIAPRKLARTSDFGADA